MCIFSHKYGKVEADGFQYCFKCGKAQKPTIPHPCENGHLWKKIAESQAHGTRFDESGRHDWNDYKISQECTRCGMLQSKWQFGH